MTEEYTILSPREKEIRKQIDLNDVRQGLDPDKIVADGKSTLDWVDTYLPGEKEQAEFKKQLKEAYQLYRLRQAKQNGRE